MDDAAPKLIDKNLREEIKRRLHERQIYDLNFYGWSRPGDYDPEMIGHPH